MLSEHMRTFNITDRCDTFCLVHLSELSMQLYKYFNSDVKSHKINHARNIIGAKIF